MKYDNCYRPESIPSRALYQRMSMALRCSGRDIALAACQWGTEDVQRWIRGTGAVSYRSTVDIQDCWKSIETIALSQIENQCYAGPGCCNDMDMLVVGMNGRGVNPETCIGGCTPEEYRTHFALWAMLGAPLILGCDVRALDEETRALLTNPQLIAIDRDPLYRSCQRIPVYGNPDAFVLSKLLHGGDIALGFFNFSDVPANVALNLWDVGLTAGCGWGLSFLDCLSGESLGVRREFFSVPVPAHGGRVYRCTPSKP